MMMSSTTTTRARRVATAWERLLLPLSGVLTLVLAWWLATDVWGMSVNGLPSLQDVVARASEPDALREALLHLRSSTRSTLTGVGLALLAGVPFGAVLAFSRGLSRLLQPALSFYMAFPNIAFIPILVLMLGFGTAAVVALGFVTGLPYIVANAQSAFERVDSTLLRVGAVYCANRRDRFTKVVLPGALPTLASGTRIGAGRVLMGVVVGEMFGSNTGLGARLVYTANFFDMPGFYLTFACLLVLGAMVTFGLQVVERRAQSIFQT